VTLAKFLQFPGFQKFQKSGNNVYGEGLSIWPIEGLSL